MNPKYHTVIIDLINEIPYGKPIFTYNLALELSKITNTDIKHCKKMVNLNLKRMSDQNIISRYQKGVYYKPKETVFGELKPTFESVITEMTTKQNEKTIGYITGNTFINQIGLTTLIPKDKEIATNKYRIKVNNDCNIKLIKPMTEIDNQNYKYLQLLDVINEFDKYYMDIENPIEKINLYIKKENIDKINLLTYAKKYYSKKTLDKAVDIVLDV